jgi:hypothetical protein
MELGLVAVYLTQAARLPTGWKGKRRRLGQPPTLGRSRELDVFVGLHESRVGEGTAPISRPGG